MTTEQFEEYISHPGSGPDSEPTLLIGADDEMDADGHLRTVANRMLRAGSCGEFADGTPFDTVAEVVGLTHDFTKLTRWAQQHLRGQSFPQEQRYTYHAFSSSLVTLYCLSECLDEVGEYAAEVATLAVAGHHNVSSPPDRAALAGTYGRLNKQVEERYRRVSAQFDDIEAHASTPADQIIEAATHGSGSWQEFRDWHRQRVESVDAANDHVVWFAELEDDPHEGHYDDLVRLWTTLKYGDQTAASGLKDGELSVVRPDREKLQKHIDGLLPGEGVVQDLNRLRNRAREEATTNITALFDTDAVGLITLPTGFGKTYAGLSAGLRAADLADSRLVYALPYTSILDQTAAEIESIFDISPYSRAFSIHHHLSDTYTGLGSHHTDADIGRAAGALHAESWRSGLTLTTTVQLFESLAAPTARQATRLPALQDSIVVIDEPQTIPDRWWKIVPRLVELLVEQYDATVVLMTATQPGLIEYGSSRIETRELAGGATYTQFLRDHPRVYYRLDESVQSESSAGSTIEYEQAGRRIYRTTADGTDSLAICNTRDSARELYQSVVSEVPDSQSPIELGRLLHEYVETNPQLPGIIELRRAAIEARDERDSAPLLVFLSGDIRPNDRALIIAALYDEGAGDATDPGPLLEQDMPVVLVSTSLVEAGVDISFDRVFRDYAPVPNLVQSGGRCNRSFEGATGEVLVWRLAKPASGARIPCLAIHGGDGGDALPLLHETSRVLDEYTDEGTIDEGTMVSEVVHSFYEGLFTGHLEPGDRELVEAVDNAEMEKLENERMIQDIESYDDVLIPLTEEEREKILGEPLDISDISAYPGVQVNTRPSGYSEEVLVGNARYLTLDGKSEFYHPVFGVQ